MSTFVIASVATNIALLVAVVFLFRWVSSISKHLMSVSALACSTVDVLGLHLQVADRLVGKQTGEGS